MSSAYKPERQQGRYSSRSRKTILAAVVLSFTGFGAAHAAEVIVEDDFAAVLFEVEDFDSADERWVLTGPMTPAQSPDPDDNHSDSASGGQYLELLPDTRVTHNDQLIANENFWQNAGDGPEMRWTLDFPEAGRYFVHARALSTGSEDNGWHVGLNDDWPESGRRMQLCAARQGWTWTNRQRGTEAGTHCGTNHTLWVDVLTAGTHVFKISAREDGTELDRIALVKHRSSDTRICTVNDASGVFCWDGTVDFADDIVDAFVEIEAESDETRIGETVSVAINYGNIDSRDVASDVVIDVQAPGWDIVSADERCDLDGGELRCEVGQILYNSVGDEPAISIELMGTEEGMGEVLASISTDSEDEGSDNDSDTVQIDVLPVLLGEGFVALEAPNTAEVDEVVAVALTVGNEGEGSLLDVQVSIAASADLALTNLPSGCDPVDAGVVCEFDEIESGDTQVLSFSLAGLEAGAKVLSATLTGDNSTGNASHTAIIVVQEIPVVIPEPESEEEPIEPVEEVPVVESEDTEVASKSSGGGGALAPFGILALLLARRRALRLRAAATTR